MNKEHTAAEQAPLLVLLQTDHSLTDSNPSFVLDDRSADRTLTFINLEKRPNQDLCQA